MAEVRILQTPSFKKTVKKLKANQKADLDDAVRQLLDNPLVGESKKGDLARKPARLLHSRSVRQGRKRSPPAF